MAKKLRLAVLGNMLRWAGSILRAFQRSGHEIHAISIDNKSVREVFDELEKIRPDFFFAYNFHICSEVSSRSPEDLELFFTANKFPGAIWYLDNPAFQGSLTLLDRWKKNGASPKNCLFFINDISFRSFFESRNIPFVHLPIGVDRDILQMRNPKLEQVWEADLRFTGQPIVSFEPEPVSVPVFREGHKQIYLREILGVVTPQIQVAGDAKANHWAESILAGLDIFFDSYYTKPSEYFSAEAKFFEHIKILPTFLQNVILDRALRLSELYSWCQMTCYLLELVPKGMIVQGSPDWKPLFPHQKEEPRLLSWDDLFSSYRTSKINFCFTKWSLPTAVHDRIYEILLAGGFPLTDFREGLAEAFEKNEIAFYRNIEEAKDMVDFYLKNDDARKSLIDRGQRRVLSSHTYDHRVQKLIEDCVSHWSL